MELETKESGLKIATLVDGTGSRPVVGDTVLMHYELWLNAGSMSSNYDHDKEEYIDDIYESTYDEKSPFSGPIELVVGRSTPKDEVYSHGESIDGLDEALLEMKVGGKVSLDIPPHLGYGSEGASSFHTFHGYRTPPNQWMRCNIELVEIKSAPDLKEETPDSGPAYEAL